MTLGLAIHTASPDLGLALIDTHHESRYQTWHLGRELSSQIHHHLMTFAQPYSWEAFDWLAVCVGPGGFTGTRMGVVVARTLAQQLDIPLFGISSLAAMAIQSRHPPDHDTQAVNQDIAVTMPAKRGAVYGAIYRPRQDDLDTVVGALVMPADSWHHKLSQWETPLTVIEIPIGEGLGDSVAGLIKLAQVRWQQGLRPHWSEAVPFYGQHPVEGRHSP